MSKKTVEQIYQKKTQHEHILARPDMYIGTIEPVTEDAWVFDEADNIMKQRRCTWIPGLYKIFDEILVNASDNKVRDFEGQTQIKVWIDGEKGMVRVFNNGEGIPVAKHKEHDLWVSEMIFGHLMTGSNYDDTEAKVTGGRNGFGAKLTNVFSSRFEVESAHSRSRKKFQMTWTNNMLNKEEAKITAYDGPDYTMITFYPDFAKFNTTGFGEDMLLIMKRRVYDIAGCTDKSLKCYLNGQKLPINTFPEYVDLFPTMGEEKKAASYSRVGDRWEVCVRVSNMGFQQVSFVNSIATTRGGNHVRYITDQIIAKVTDAAKKRKVEAKPHMIKPHLFVFINCQIENPGFDSQTKDTLNTTKPKFGSSCDLPNSMIDYILKSGIVERTVEMANSKLQKEMASKLKNSDRRQVLGIPKLDDANEAGGKYSSRCTLILTEGDSAKALCTAGLAVKDRDYFGVFPLRGKPLNVRDANLKKVMACEEIQSVMKIMGLDMRQNYTSPDSLRYGHLMIMSDQDHDGSHIKGLIINFIHHYWPELVKFPGFLQQFITPIVKAREKGSQRSVSFFSMPTYLEWRQRLGPAATAKYDIRYYKGLGTSGSKEGREYFENIDRHRLDFVFNSARDDERIKMAFAKDKVEDRKQWITAFRNNENAAEQMDYSIKRVPYSDFIDKELILFSVADCERSIPSVVDGLKPGQRKVLFSCFKRNLVKAIKVAQLAGYVSEHSAYHHGEASLVATIVALAQDFVGSNNLPILQQDGQFGTRLQGGKDHAAGRYIFTRLTTAARLLYHRDDDFTVDYRDDDGLSVEPFYYVPVIPMVLVNGTAGIGTGFATNIPNYSPYDVIHNIRRLLQGEELLPMAPWYFGFKGTIEEKEKGKFISRGKMNVLPNNVISITELPIGTWTQPYKKYLEDLREREVVVQYREYNTDVTVDFEIMLHPTAFELWSAQGVLEERLQLREYIHATNIIAFSKDGQLTKYADAEAVIKEFYLIRIDYYNRRKDYMLGELRRAVSKLENMVRFVREVVAGTLVVTRRKKKELLDELVSKKYVAFPPAQKKKLSSTTIGDGEGDAPQQNVEDLEDQYLAAAVGEDAGRDADEAVSKASRDYDYLLGMKLWSLTLEMINRLEAQMQRAKADLTTLEKRTPREMWSDDLDALERHMKKHYADREAEISGILKKKLGLKREFEAHRVRVPVLSDKARAALSKDSEKFSKANKKSAKDGDDGTAEAQPKPKKVVKRKKKKSSDSEDNVDSSSDEDDDSGPDPFGDEETPAKAPRAPRAKAAAAPKAKKAPAPKRAKKKKGSDSDESSPDDSSEESSAASGESDSDAPLVAKKKASTKPPPKSRGARTESGSKPSGAKAAAVNVDDDDDFLSGFGLGAIGGSHPEKKASPPKPKATARPQAATAQKPAAPSFLDDDDDDLLTLGERKAVAPPPPTARKISVAGAVAAAKPAPKAAAKKPAKKRRRGSDSESSDSSSEESSDESDFDF